MLVLHKGSWMIARRRVTLAVEGLEHVPLTGPLLIAARHFHHFYDGCVLMRAVPRRLHIFVALDWVRKRWVRSMMEMACTMADWPMILRTEQLNKNATQHSETASGAYSLVEARSYLRHAITDSVRLLRNGETLVVFPEAYPNIDPGSTPKVEKNEFLPFRPGFARLVEMAERDEQTRVAIVPAGLSYTQNERFHITLRFGPALSRSDYTSSTQLVQEVEKRVRELSEQHEGDYKGLKATTRDRGQQEAVGRPQEIVAAMDVAGGRQEAVGRPQGIAPTMDVATWDAINRVPTTHTEETIQL